MLLELGYTTFAICMEFSLCFVILELAKTERIEALKKFDYVALRKGEKYM